MSSSPGVSVPTGAVQLNSHKGGAYDVVALPPTTAFGARVVTASCDGNARVFAADSGDLLCVFRAHRAAVRALAALGPDLVASGDAAGTLCLWRARDGTEVWRSALGRGKVLSIARVSHGRFVVGTWDGDVVWFSHDKGREVKEERVVDGAHACAVSCIAVCGGKMVTGSYDESAKVWDVDGGEEIGCLKGHEFWVRGVAIDRDRIVTTSGTLGRGSVRIWDAEDFSLLGNIAHAHRLFVDCAVLVAGHYVLTGSRDSTVNLIEIESGVSVMKEKLPFPVAAIEILPDGRLAAAGLGGEVAALVWMVEGDGAEVIRAHWRLRGLAAEGEDYEEIEETVKMFPDRPGVSFEDGSMAESEELEEGDILIGDASGEISIRRKYVVECDGITCIEDGEILISSPDGSFSIDRVVGDYGDLCDCAEEGDVIISDVKGKRAVKRRSRKGRCGVCDTVEKGDVLIGNESGALLLKKSPRRKRMEHSPMSPEYVGTRMGYSPVSGAYVADFEQSRMRAICLNDITPLHYQGAVSGDTRVVGASPGSPIDYRSDFSEMKRRGISAEIVEPLPSEQIAKLIAAFLVGYNEMASEYYDHLRESIMKGLSEAGVASGDFLVGEDASVSFKSFSDAVIGQLSVDNLVKKSTVHRIKCFLKHLESTS